MVLAANGPCLYDGGWKSYCCKDPGKSVPFMPAARVHRLIAGPVFRSMGRQELRLASRYSQQLDWMGAIVDCWWVGPRLSRTHSRYRLQGRVSCWAGSYRNVSRNHAFIFHEVRVDLTFSWVSRDGTSCQPGTYSYYCCDNPNAPTVCFWS